MIMIIRMIFRIKILDNHHLVRWHVVERPRQLVKRRPLTSTSPASYISDISSNYHHHSMTIVIIIIISIEIILILIFKDLHLQSNLYLVSKSG